jgi:hypothetical protein
LAVHLEECGLGFQFEIGSGKNSQGDCMTRILFDMSRLKREFTRESLQAWAEFLAECNRANFYYKSDGWSQGELVDFDVTGFAEMELKWGDDQNDHEQYSDLVEYDIEKFYHEFDKMKQKYQTNPEEIVG